MEVTCCPGNREMEKLVLPSLSLLSFSRQKLYGFICMPFIGALPIYWLDFLHIVFFVVVFVIHFCFVVAFFINYVMLGFGPDTTHHALLFIFFKSLPAQVFHIHVCK